MPPNQHADPTVQLMIKLPHSLKHKLDSHARDARKTTSQVVRESLALTLSLPTTTALMPRHTHPTATARKEFHNTQARNARRLLRVLAQTNPQAIEVLLGEKTA